MEYRWEDIERAKTDKSIFSADLEKLQGFLLVLNKSSPYGVSETEFNNTRTTVIELIRQRKEDEANKESIAVSREANAISRKANCLSWWAIGIAGSVFVFSVVQFCLGHNNRASTLPPVIPLPLQQAHRPPPGVFSATNNTPATSTNHTQIQPQK